MGVLVPVVVIEELCENGDKLIIFCVCTWRPLEGANTGARGLRGALNNGWLSLDGCQLMLCDPLLKLVSSLTEIATGLSGVIHKESRGLCSVGLALQV